ncbi:MAG: hypothetical protein QMC74_08190 [Myxococcota bacterium]|jgi:hypothetical protein
MFETDFPHATCLYPGVQESMRESLEGIAPRVQRKLLYETAARVYQISLPEGGVTSLDARGGSARRSRYSVSTSSIAP